MKYQLKSAIGLFAFAAAFLAGQAIAAEKKVGKEGGFDMIAIWEKNGFDRCALSQGSGNNMLRIARTTAGLYSLSIPTLKNGGAMQMVMSFDGGPEIDINAAGQNKVRTWATMTDEAMNGLRNSHKALTIQLGFGDYKWRLNPDMESSLMVLDSCVEGYAHGA